MKLAACVEQDDSVTIDRRRRIIEAVNYSESESEQSRDTHRSLKVFAQVKLQRAYGGCLGTNSR